MRRRQLVELEDLHWFPVVLRDGATAFLDVVERVTGHARRMAPIVERALPDHGVARVIDLCSGGGGPAVAVVEELTRRGRSVSGTLTDLYPNESAFEMHARRTGGQVVGLRVPVDAGQVPPDLDGVRTLFNSFHHFPPERARGILADACTQRQPIVVLELVTREWAMLAGLLLVPLAVVLSMPFWRPFRWSWVVWTWLVPVLPVAIAWDGLVSWMRVYDLDELRALVAPLESPDWRWEVGKVRHGRSPVHGTWLLGLPRS